MSAEALPIFFGGKRFGTVMHVGSTPRKHPLTWRISWTGFHFNQCSVSLWTLWYNNSIHPFVSHPFWSIFWAWGIPPKTRSVTLENIWPDRVSIWTVTGRRAVNPFFSSLLCPPEISTWDSCRGTAQHRLRTQLRNCVVAPPMRSQLLTQGWCSCKITTQIGK